MLEQLLLFLVYGAFGLLLEIFFTASHDVLVGRNRAARGVTSLWMHPVYASGAFCLQGLSFIDMHPAIFILVGVGIVYFVEFTFGLVMRSYGLRLWDYQHSRFHIMGLVRLDYVAFWAAVVVIYLISHEKVEKLVYYALNM